MLTHTSELLGQARVIQEIGLLVDAWRGFPLGRAWWAKALWCLALCTLSNLVVFGIYLAGSAFSSQGLTVAGTLGGGARTVQAPDGA